MKLTNFIGPTYRGLSTQLDSSRAINFYPELNPNQESKAVIALVGTPGTMPGYVVDPYGPIRGMHTLGGKFYIVCGNSLYSIDATGLNYRGNLLTEAGGVCIRDNQLTATGVGGNQIMVVDGTAGYVYNVITGAYTTVYGGAGGFPVNPSQIEFIDGYMVATNDTMSHFSSNLYDALTWNALATGQASATIGGIRSVQNISEQLYFIKRFSTEIWYNAGVATSVGTPFARQPGAVVGAGTEAGWSVVKGNSSIYMLGWLDQGGRGEFVGPVQMAGLSAVPIAPPAIVASMQKWPKVSGCAFMYSDNGHTFYQVTDSDADQTFVFDTTTNMWHERSTWRDEDPPNKFGRHVANCYCNYGGKHYVGDYQSGTVFEMSSDYYTDNGAQIISKRRTSHLFDKNDLENLFVTKLQIDCEMGRGDGTKSYADDPQAILSWSNDGGCNWSNMYATSLGKVGETQRRRAIWRRLGASKNRVWDLTITDPIRKILMNGYAEVE